MTGVTRQNNTCQIFIKYRKAITMYELSFSETSQLSVLAQSTHHNRYVYSCIYTCSLM